MNTLQISSILKSNTWSSKIFIGVLPRDHFVRFNIIYPSLFVCNTDNSDQPGTHWVAAYFSKDQKCEYFDSYGIPPLFDDLRLKLLSIDRDFVYNRSTLQGLNTDVCGVYCVVFAVMRAKGHTLNDIVTTFLLSKTCDERDRIMKYFMKSNFLELVHSPLASSVHAFSNSFTPQNRLCRCTALAKQTS